MERIGIIGGSGLYNIEGLTVKDEVTLSTPFGEPSDTFVVAGYQDKEIVFLPRHGCNHSIAPSQINYRANIYGMKMLNVERILSVTACGSLKKEYAPLHFVIPTQFVDRTRQARKDTFFDQDIVAHIGFAQPVCTSFAQEVFKAAKTTGVTVHYGGTYVNIEGPQFSTLAESNLYRSWGMDIIGMTNMTEARLAREAEICYVTLAAVTDYDCWHEAEETVSVDFILENLKKNVDNSQKIIKNIMETVPVERKCSCGSALEFAIVTSRETIPQAAKQRLAPLVKKYL